MTHAAGRGERAWACGGGSGCAEAGRLGVSLDTAWIELNNTRSRFSRRAPPLPLARAWGWEKNGPFWMSSTQWGMVETVWAEGGVTGGSWAACVTLLSCLWVSPYGIRGAHFLQASSCAIAIAFAITRRLEVKVVIYRSSAAPYVRVFLVCPPTHPGMGGCPVKAAQRRRWHDTRKDDDTKTTAVRDGPHGYRPLSLHYHLSSPTSD